MSQPIFSNRSFIEWLKSKDPNEHYEYRDPNNCLLGQYFKAKGLMNFASLSGNTISLTIGHPIDFPVAWQGIARERLSTDEYPIYGEKIAGWTFGAALQRAEAMLEV